MVYDGGQQWLSTTVINAYVCHYLGVANKQVSDGERASKHIFESHESSAIAVKK